MIDKEKQIIEITKKEVRKDTDNTGVMANLLKQEQAELQKAKQIEEMANCFKCVCKPVCMKTADISKEEELLSWNEYVKSYGCKHYKPKIDQDKEVVLTKEEYNLIDHNIKHLEGVCNNLEEYASQLEKELKQARKETAEKIIDFIEEKDKKAGKFSIYKKLLEELKEKFGEVL